MTPEEWRSLISLVLKAQSRTSPMKKAQTTRRRGGLPIVNFSGVEFPDLTGLASQDVVPAYEPGRTRDAPMFGAMSPANPQNQVQMGAFNTANPQVFSMATGVETKDDDEKVRGFGGRFSG